MKTIIGYILMFPLSLLLICQFSNMGFPWYMQLVLAVATMSVYDVGLMLKESSPNDL